MTTIAELPDFSKAHPRHRSYQPCPPATIARYRGRLPDLLVDSWAADGFQVFSDGFLWTVDPDQFRPLAAGFVYDSQLDDVDVMLRTAFGDLLLAHQGSFYYFSALTMHTANVPADLEGLLEAGLAHSPALDRLYFFKMYKRALKTLGPLAADEVYALAPAAALGGAIRAENLHKTKLRPYLRLLADLQSPD